MLLIYSFCIFQFHEYNQANNILAGATTTVILEQLDKYKDESQLSHKSEAPIAVRCFR